MAKPKKQQPFLPMFVGDFFAATAEWEGEAEALYALLLMRQWSIGHLPAEVSKLARLVKYDPATFERWWATVGPKFELVEVDGFGPRLVNHRLENHRAKSKALSEKNSQAGKAGADAKWRKDGERHTEDVASATAKDGERQKSAIAAGNGNPSHPIPSHPNPSHGGEQRSSPAPRSVAQAVPAIPVSSKDLELADSVAAVFEHWRQAHDHPRAQLDDKRRKLIRHALKRYSESDLCQAISGYLNSPHHMGENERNTRYDDIGLLLRDANHIDAGLRLYAEPPRTDLSEQTRRIVRQTEDWVPPEARYAAK